MIAGTRRDVALLNRATRDQLIERGDLDNEHTVKIDGHEFCGGDRVLFTRNSRQLDVKNGDLASLTHIEVNDDDLILHAETDAGKRVSWNASDYEHFQHGYSVTAHKSQGITVDHAHVLISDGMSDREWSYVAASRSRDATHLYCTNDTYTEAARTMSRSRQADTSLDYQQEITDMAQIPELGEEINESELEAQTHKETMKLLEPEGFDELLDEISDDEKQDEERRKKFIEMQKQKEEEEEEERKKREREEEKEKEKKNDDLGFESDGGNSNDDAFKQFEKQQEELNAEESEVGAAGGNASGGTNESEAGPEKESGGFEAEI